MTEKQTDAGELVDALNDADYMTANVVRGHVVLAHVGYRELPELDVYTPKQVRKWARDFRRFLRENPDYEPAMAAEETRPALRGGEPC